MPEINPCVFLIDDDQDDLDMLTSSLEPHGIKIKTFASGYIAMSYFEIAAVVTELPSLIIIDYNMPLLNGLETLAMIKNKETIKHIPVVMYSTVINPLFEAEASKFGAHACESKAVSVLEFEEQVSRFADLAYSCSENDISCRREI